MAIHVGTFAEFLTAIQGTEDIVLTADLDAKNEDTIPGLSISCNVDGQGHAIANVTVINSSQNIMKMENYKSMKNLEFKNLLVKATASVVVFSGLYESNAIAFENCKFGMQLDTANTYSWTLGSIGSGGAGIFKNCAFDITIKNPGNYSGNSFVVGHLFRECNIVIRGAKMSESSYNSSFGSLTFSALVLSECQILNRRGYSVGGTNAYVVFHNCTTTLDTVPVTISSGAYFCNDSNITCSISGAGTELTSSQLQDENYLLSIGFLP